MGSVYETPLNSRYASREMLYLFSPDRKFRTWRRLWIALAETQRELGLDVSETQIQELRDHADEIDYVSADAHEREVRHDVMAHILAYGDQCPSAKGIIHLGATSCYVGDNTDLMLMAEGLDLLRVRLVAVVAELADFAARYRAVPTLGFTHFQPAQPVTVGKRATLWIEDLLSDLEDLDHVRSGIRLLGSKGTTGTQASFLELFDGDHGKVRELDRRIAKKMGYPGVVPVSGQTYSRKTDFRVLSVLSGIAQSAHRFSNDIRLLQHLKEIEEPFEEKQVGSSAMPYKRNPMRCERIASLSRYVMADLMNPAMTAATQWFERTLDDSANKRISVPEAFLSVDAVLSLYRNVAGGLVVNRSVIRRHLAEELPFMATEMILMQAVKRGGDRQVLHERIRAHSMKAGATVKVNGLPNDLIERLAGDTAFGMTREELDALLDPALHIGRCPEQVDEYLEEVVKPILDRNEDARKTKAPELRV